MKSIVMLVGSYYPNFSAVGKCQFYIANELVKKGYSVHVICISNDIALNELEIYKGQYIHRILIRSKKKLINYVYRGLKRVSLDILDRHLVSVYYKALSNLDFVPDVLIPTCLPFESIYVCQKYKMNHSECRIIVFLYDMFAESRVLYKWRFEKRIKYQKTRKIEDYALQCCDGILYVKSWGKYLNTFYANLNCKKEEVEHPLITPIIESINDIKEESRVGQDSCIKLMYAGMLTKDYVEADYLIKCLLLFNSIDDMRFIFYSQGNGIADLDVDNLPIFNYGWVDHSALIEGMKIAQVLISISEKSGRQISSKIFEYMSTGKPIIHIYYTDDDVNLSYLSEYPICLCLKADYDNVAENAKRLEEWIQEHFNDFVEYQTVATIYERLTPEYVCKRLIDMLD